MKRGKVIGFSLLCALGLFSLLQAGGRAESASGGLGSHSPNGLAECAGARLGTAGLCQSPVLDLRATGGRKSLSLSRTRNGHLSRLTEIPSCRDANIFIS